MQNIYYKATKICVSGVSETGKTTWIERYIKRSAVNQYDKIFIFDWQDGEFFHTRFNDNKNIDCVYTIDEAFNSEKQIICYIPKSDIYEAVDDFSCVLLSAQEEQDEMPRVLFVLDEIGQIYQHGKLPSNFKRLTVAGRRLQIDTVFCCHQLNEIHYTLRNMLNFIVCFRQTDALGCKWLLDRHLKNGERELEYTDLSTLKTGQYFFYDIVNHTIQKEKMKF